MPTRRRLLSSALFLLAPGSSAWAAAVRRRRSSGATRRGVLPSLIVPAAASDWDRAVAQACQRGLGRSGGGVVAMDPRTGRVVTLVNPANVLIRAYQPCSVFKIVVAVAGLTEGVIDPETTYVCEKGCWMWPGHGPINLRRALAVSCNPYFEWIGEGLGYEKIQSYAQSLGLGAPSGINLTGETAGRLPARVPAAAVGHLSSHAAGIATSAIQLAVLLSATINGGIVFQPQVAGPDGFRPKERWRLPEGTVLDGLADGFLGAVNEGSAASAFDPDVVVAGKTGSCSRLGWFASYAPASQPKLVLVVFMRPGSGHSASAVAGRIYQEIFRPSPPPQLVGG
jgi:cell division protein FtsI/penicillin-binding protein 2